MAKNPKRIKAQRSGHIAEWVACGWLMMKGYRLIARRYKTKRGEIDLIMRRGRTLVFIEVKARRRHDDAAYSIHSTNQQRVMRAAEWFIQAHPLYQHCDFRFDAVLISCYYLPHHLRHAFSYS